MKTFASDFLNYFSRGYLCQEKPLTSVEKLYKQLNKCPQSQALVENAQKVLLELELPSLEIRLCYPEINFRASTQGNIIRIDPNLTASEQRYLAIFELTNVIHLKEHLAVRIAAAQGVYKCSEDYVRAAELIEYNGNKIAKQVSSEINTIKGRFFRPYIECSWKNTPLDWLGFDFYYKYFIGNNHKEHHRNNWRIIITNFNPEYLNSDMEPQKSSWAQRALKITLIGCYCIAVGAATFYDFYRLSR